MTEYLDIVDEEDNVIEKDTRKNVHARHEIHRGVHVFVINSKREMLVQKRSENKDYYPGYYDASVGAQVLSGESYEQAAARETEEELGFAPKNLEKICDYNSYSTRQREKRRLFVCRENGPFKIDKNEVESTDWLSLKKINNEIEKGEIRFTEGFMISFQNYMDHKKFQ